VLAAVVGMPRLELPVPTLGRDHVNFSSIGRKRACHRQKDPKSGTGSLNVNTRLAMGIILCPRKTVAFQPPAQECHEMQHVCCTLIESTSWKVELIGARQRTKSPAAQTFRQWTGQGLEQRAVAPSLGCSVQPNFGMVDYITNEVCIGKNNENPHDGKLLSVHTSGSHFLILDHAPSSPLASPAAFLWCAPRAPAPDVTSRLGQAHISIEAAAFLEPFRHT